MFMLVGQPSKVTVKSTGVDATRLFYFTLDFPHFSLRGTVCRKITFR